MPEDGHGPAPGAIHARSLGDIALGLLGRALFPEPRAPEGPEESFLAACAARLGGTEDLAARIASGLRAPKPREVPLARAAAALDLTGAEVTAAALLLAVETEALAGRAVAYLQAPLGGARPTLGLLATILAPLEPAPGLAARIASGAAVRAGLCRLDGDGPIPERALRLPDGLVTALTGGTPNWPGLTLAPEPDPDWPASLVDALDPVADAVAEDRRLLLVVRAAAPGDRAEVLARLGARVGRQAALIDPEATELPGLGPLCAAAHLLPGFTVNPGAGEYRHLPALPGHAGPVVAFIGPEGQTRRSDLRAVEWTVPVPTPGERADLWRGLFPDGPLAERLGAEHLQSAGRIRELARSTEAAARMAGRLKPDAEALRSALWASEGEGLGALAHPVRDEIPDEAMVAAPALRDELEILLARCRARERLTEGLGPSIAARYKLGVRALFTGPSGTGKTMGAAWLAGRLTLPIYRVDLAAVISKYIGETEKNLARLLATAEQQEVILLFDEADALFGKRTDISDSNDRFANAQTNYLLQRIETYTGIVLLTSNARNRFDDAFTRRIDLIVEFLMPQPAERLALWQAHLGGGHAIAPGDLNRLAAMAELAGGHIRNAVLMAAVLAKSEGQPISFAHLLAGLKAEYRKLGWTVPSELLSGAAD